MRKFFNNYFLPTVVILFVLGQAFSMHSCTQVEDSLGENLIPVNQQVKMKIDTIGAGNIKSYIVHTDSVVSNYRRQILIGNISDPVFGKTNAATVVKFYPYSNAFNNGDLYGYNPVADSVKLKFYIRDIYGDNTVEQTFNIYAMKDSLPRDSLYYTNLDIAGLGLVDLDDPLFSFTTQHEYAEITIFPLDITDSGKAYLQRIVEIDSAILADPYYEFPELFNGLYIAPAPDSPEDAAIYNIELYEDYYYTDYSMLMIYSHNYERNTNTPTVKDTVTSFYIFDSGTDLAIPNMEVNTIKHDFPADISLHVNDTTENSADLPLVYVQGLNGVATYLKFTDDFMAEIDALRIHEGVEYRNITINQAVLYMYLDDFSTEALDEAPFKLGMYDDYTGYTPTPIIDYAYNYESNYTVPYGGKLNRSNGYYSMDLTIYVSFLLQYPELVQRELWVGPSISTSRNYIIEDYSQVIIKGSVSDQPMRMVLTYTLIK